MLPIVLAVDSGTSTSYNAPAIWSITLCSRISASFARSSKTSAIVSVCFVKYLASLLPNSSATSSIMEPPFRSAFAAALSACSVIHLFIPYGETLLSSTFSITNDSLLEVVLGIVLDWAKAITEENEAKIIVIIKKEKTNLLVFTKYLLQKKWIIGMAIPWYWIFS